MIRKALASRFAPSNSVKPDLEFVPWPCLMRGDGGEQRRPRFGRFTVFSGAWASFTLELFDDTRAMCASNCSTRLLRGMVVLSIESPAYLVSWDGKEGEEAAISASRLPPPPSGSVYQIPYPTSAHFDGKELPLVANLASRTALLALVANLGAPCVVAGRSTCSSKGTIGRGPIRTLLHSEVCATLDSLATNSLLVVCAIVRTLHTRNALTSADVSLWQCRAAPPGTCLVRGAQRGGSRIYLSNNETFAVYSAAIFCLQPWGDSSTRKGFWDAIIAGCINVVFSEAGWNETDAWFGDHRQYTVRAPLSALRSAGGVLGWLRALPQPRVQALHTRVLAVRGRMQYAIDAGTPGGDAVDSLVRGVVSHFQRQRHGQLVTPVVDPAAARLPLAPGCKTFAHICRQLLVPQS